MRKIGRILTPLFLLIILLILLSGCKRDDRIVGIIEEATVEVKEAFSQEENGVESIEENTSDRDDDFDAAATTVSDVSANSDDVSAEMNQVESIDDMQSTIVSESQGEFEQNNFHDIVWMATHENGTIDEWENRGGFYRQGPTGAYRIVPNFAHTGSKSVALTIDTSVSTRSEEIAHAAYLFFTDQLEEDAYYYSVWYYLPEDVQPALWWNIFQWKTTYDQNTDNSAATYIVGIEEWENHGLRINLHSHIDEEIVGIGDFGDFHQEIIPIPTQQWVHIEGYYKKSMEKSGQVVIWQDGVELFNLSGIKTTLADNTVYWSVNSYTDEIQPNPLTILIDDAAISKSRLGPDTRLFVP